MLFDFCPVSQFSPVLSKHQKCNRILITLMDENLAHVIVFTDEYSHFSKSKTMLMIDTVFI